MNEGQREQNVEEAVSYLQAGLQYSTVQRNKSQKACLMWKSTLQFKQLQSKTKEKGATDKR